MSSTTDKINGLANEAVGNVKQVVGKAVGNDRLQAEGIAQEVKGEAQQTVGKAKDAEKSWLIRLNNSIFEHLKRQCKPPFFVE
jgi:uncharacterized protein YjbJ (UPF0337 family)